MQYSGGTSLVKVKVRKFNVMRSIKEEFKGLLKKRPRGSHKGDFGHVFILAGSKGLTGAAALCSNAVLRSGAGLATLGIPVSLNSAMAKKLTEVMTLSLAETKDSTLSLKAESQYTPRTISWLGLTKGRPLAGLSKLEEESIMFFASSWAFLERGK